MSFERSEEKFICHSTFGISMTSEHSEEKSEDPGCRVEDPEKKARERYDINKMY